MTTASDVALQPLPERQQDRLYHELVLGPETEAIRREVRAFGAGPFRVIAHAVAHADEPVDGFPWAGFEAMRDAGLFTIPFPESIGGRGLDRPVAATAVALEELAYVSNSFAAVYDVHCILSGRSLQRGTPEVVDRCLTRVVSGEAVGAFATTEPLASSDLSPRAVSTLARRVHDGWTITGHKRFISNAPVASFVSVLCGTDEGLTLLVVDTDAAGFSVGVPDRKMGNRGQLTADVTFEDVFVPDEHRIGDVGQGLRIALETLTYGRVGIAATGVGMAQCAFDLAVAHLQSRRAFGKRIADFQHWQFRMAERATQLEAARSMYVKAAVRMDAGETFPEPEAAMAKAYATRLAVELADDAVQVFGGYGYLRELAATHEAYKLEELYRDAKIAEIYEGTNEIQKWIVARSIFGQDVRG